MSQGKSLFDEESYREFARKMRLFEDGPTTTILEQLLESGTHVPEPSAVADYQIRTTLWEVLAGLQRLKVFLDHTDHLSDRELYARLWNDILCDEVPVSNELGLNHCVTMLRADDEVEEKVYLKYFADGDWRRFWVKDNPGRELPPHEEPPFNRDCLLPNPIMGFPEAEGWLRANWNPRPLARNRFENTAAAVAFVEQLYAAGAKGVGVDRIEILASDDWTPYADCLIVELPDEPAKARDLLAVIRNIGLPAEEDLDPIKRPLNDSKQAFVRVRWD